MRQWNSFSLFQASVANSQIDVLESQWLSRSAFDRPIVAKASLSFIFLVLSHIFPAIRRLVGRSNVYFIFFMFINYELDDSRVLDNGRENHKIK